MANERDKMTVELSWRSALGMFSIVMGLVALTGISVAAEASLSLPLLQDIFRIFMAFAFAIAAAISYVFPWPNHIVKVLLVGISTVNAVTIFALAVDSGSELLRLHVIIVVALFVAVFIVALFSLLVDVAKKNTEGVL